MHLLLSDKTAQQAAGHLARADPIMAPVIAATGPCTVRPHDQYFKRLVESIIGQQLSVKAASTIRGRFVDMFGGTFPEPAAILGKDFEELKSCGLSNSKTNYIRDLAVHVLEDRLKFEEFSTLENEEIIKELVAVKGIGPWTAHMFLLFSLGRMDVLATGDLGVRSGIQKLYKLPKMPTPTEIVKLAHTYKWHPYESIACWYIWRSLDNEPK